MIYKLMYKNKFIEKVVLKVVCKLQKGEQNSAFIRKYYKKFFGIDVGLYSYGCFNRNFNSGGKSIIIGKYCSIAANVRYFGANHPMHSFSLSPFFYNKLFGFDVEDVSRKELIIEDDVWIGYNTIITSGCKKIGRGSVIGAGSIVTHDVDEYTVVAGNPAKFIKFRFDKEKQKMLNNSRWWNYSPEELIGLKEYFYDIDNFCSNIKNVKT